MRRHRIEIFNRADLSFVAFAECSEPDINIDFLVSAESTVTCPGQVAGNIGDFAQVRINGRVYYQGILTDINFDGTKTEITLQQMSELLNTQVFADVSLLNSQSIETWLGNLFSVTFNGSDPSARLPGFTLETGTATTGTHAASDDGVYNLYELVVSFFKVYGVILRISFDFDSRSVLFAFRSVSDTVLKLNLNVSDVIEFEVQPSLVSDSPNKIILRNQANKAEMVTYYWHPTDFSGTIDTNPNTNRSLPVIAQCEEISLDEGTTFSAAAYARAQEVLYSTRYDDLITVTIRSDSALVNTWEIGQLFTLYADDKTYNTLLTGIHAPSMASIELTFGYVRKRLTQILKMKK